MNKPVLLLALLALPTNAATVRTLDNEFSLSGASRIEVKIAVGDLEVVGVGGDAVKVHVDASCPNATDAECRSLADNIAVGNRRSGDALVIEIEGFPKLRSNRLSANVRIEMPRALPLSTNTGVGDVHVAGLVGDVEIDSGVGDVRVKIDPDKVRSAELDSGVGDVTLKIKDQVIEGSGFVGQGLDWSSGKGTAKLEVDTGVGDIAVELD